MTEAQKELVKKIMRKKFRDNHLTIKRLTEQLGLTDSVGNPKLGKDSQKFLHELVKENHNIVKTLNDLNIPNDLA